MRIAMILALVLGLAACSSAPALPALPDLSACGPDDECPPVDDIVLPGRRVPVYKTIQKPIYEERRTPVWGEKTVAVFQTRAKPVTITLPDGCNGCDRVVKLWERDEKIQVGTRRVPACLGYRVEKVQVGTCPEQVRVGWRVEAEEPCAP